MRELKTIFTTLSLLLAFVQLTSATAQTQQASDLRVVEWVRAGKIRVGLFVPQYIKDPSTGELKGVRVEIARALGARIGVQVVLLEHPTPPEAIACLKVGACDLLFLPFDARAADVGDFSPPIFQFDFTLWCLLAPQSAASPTQTDPRFASRPYVITHRPLN